MKRYLLSDWHFVSAGPQRPEELRSSWMLSHAFGNADVGKFKTHLRSCAFADLELPGIEQKQHLSGWLGWPATYVDARQTVQQPTFSQISRIWEKAAAGGAGGYIHLCRDAAAIIFRTAVEEFLSSILRSDFLCPLRFTRDALGAEEEVHPGNIEDNFGFRPAGSIFSLSTPAPQS